MIIKKPYKGKYPTAAETLIREGVCKTPRQTVKELQWAEALDIVYPLVKMTPARFEKYSEFLLMLAYQEAMRYKDIKYAFAGFDVKLGRMKKGKDLPEVVTFQAAMHTDFDVMVWGPGYEVPQRYFLYNKVEDILELTKRYSDRINKQAPYEVIRLFISIREPRGNK